MVFAHCLTLLSEPRSEKGRREVKFADPGSLGSAAGATTPRQRGGHLAAVALLLKTRSSILTLEMRSCLAW
jgi:hypothetical protein